MAKSNAERQAAFRTRLKERLSNRPLVAIAAPAIDNMPAERRWTALQDQAHHALTQARDEMQAYYDDRSQNWQESERGEAMAERINTIDSILSELENLIT